MWPSYKVKLELASYYEVDTSHTVSIAAISYEDLLLHFATCDYTDCFTRRVANTKTS